MLLNDRIRSDSIVAFSQGLIGLIRRQDCRGFGVLFFKQNTGSSAARHTRVQNTESARRTFSTSRFPFFRLLFRPVLDNFSLVDVDGLLGNVGREIGDAFEITSHQDEGHPLGDKTGIFHHEG